MSRQLEFTCPCGVSFGVPPILAGNVGRCPVCARTLSVPTPQPQPPLEAEAAPSFQLVRVPCACGREIPAPRARVRAGEARCPSCDRVLKA